MDSLAKMLKYPTQIEKPVDPKNSVIHMLGYGKDTKVELSPRQLDMLNYHTSIEQPSFFDKLKIELGVVEDKGGCSPSSLSVSFSDEPTIIPDILEFSITDIQ